ncbi:MAG: T9SS C-terminal target domain-containing protein [Calditrichaeota bacterium]|nr:MAG: T9SS C-terminal target domain-containing protein [Calditrichota bacterium]
MKKLSTLLLTLILGLALATNSFATKMYWTDTGTNEIQRADLDGSNVEDLVTTGLSTPVGIAVDLTNSKMYWVDDGTDKIQRADLDGSNVQDLVTGLDTPEGIALDLTNSKMYWTDYGTDKIQRADLDGSNVEDLVTTGLSLPVGIALDLTNSKMYWIDDGTNKIQRADLDGSNVEDLVTGLDFPIGITIGINDAPLSVELNSFTARQIENSISLNWSTASETENEGFNVYRKTGNGNFIQIASYKSHNELLGQGNSTFQNNYSFVDNSQLRNNELYTYYISDVETNELETKHETQSQAVKFVLGEEEVISKKEYKLAQNFPNPFNPSTTISYQIAKDTRVSLKIYNIKGEFVKELTKGFQQEGSHNVVWNGTDENGKSVSNGTYFYKLTAGTFTQTNKMILLK